MPEIVLEITNKVGLHARPAALFVQAASKFTSDILIVNGGTVANAKSILEVLMLGADQGCVIKVQAEGEDAEAALTSLAALHANNFGEAE